ncbi:MAG: WecB/TagA/CpsF family glycosyltransferase [Planctomycetota bacterium]|nr:WecB/TagA/CpsF family glycosyltransferase [Planctomycetota bacterium]
MPTPLLSESAQVTILGSTVHLPSRASVLDQIRQWVAAPRGRCHQIVVTGFHGLWEAHQNADVQRVLNASDLWIPDGAAPVIIARLRGHQAVERIPGAELMTAVFEQGRTLGYRHYFYGDTDETLAALKTAVETRWPGNVVVGAFSPPFRRHAAGEVAAYVQRINDAKPDFLWVALGLPKQDRWIHEHKQALSVPVAVGVGAAFAFVAGTVDRAPKWMGRYGLEWLYRLIKEPRKCWRRSMIQGPQFLYAVFQEQARLRKRKR